MQKGKPTVYVISDDEFTSAFIVRAACGEDRVKGALINERMEAKPVYRRLRKLIAQEWRTRLSARTDSSGILHPQPVLVSCNGNYAPKPVPAESEFRIVGRVLNG